MTHFQRIKAEFNEPFSEIVRAFAIQGHSRRAVAQILGMSQMQFMVYVKRYDCDKYFRPYREMRPEAKNRWGRKGKPHKKINSLPEG